MLFPKTMFKKTTLFPLFLMGILFSLKTNAQSSINSSNAYLEQSTGSISYSIGQLQQATFLKDGNMLTQGFQQPLLLISSTDNLAALGLEIKAFPNPTSAQLQLKFTKGFAPNEYQVQLYDLFGRLHLQTKLSAAQSEIDLSNQAGGTYLIRLLSKGQAIHTFKILKTK